MGRDEILRHPRRFGAALRGVCFLAAAAPIAIAAQPACAPDPTPAYPALDAAPAVKVVHDADWTPPPCTAWPPAKGAIIATVAARFQAADASAIRGRIAAVSQLSGLLYWSTTTKRWQPMILSARTVAGRDPSPVDLLAGAVVELRQEDNLFGAANYRMRILVSTADRIVAASENTTPLKFLGMTAFAPVELQSVTFLDRESKDVWRYYNLTRSGKAAALLPGRDESLINRAVAMFRYLAGIPADREPPAAR